MKKSFFLLLFCGILSATINAQTYGKLYSKLDADNTYGAVLSSITIETAELLSLLEKSKSVIMFYYSDENLSILGDNRTPLFQKGRTIENSDILRVFSKSIVKELLDKGQNSVTYIEKRKEVLSLTNGEYTLEYTVGCPPNCI